MGMMQSFPSRPEADDKLVVEEMRGNPESIYWHECYEFVKRRVSIQAKNIPPDHWDDLTQDVLMKIHRSLKTFHYESKLSTWIIAITRHCIADLSRNDKRVKPFQAILGNRPDSTESEDSISPAPTALTTEDEVMIRIDLATTIEALKSFVADHLNKNRNAQILETVLIRGNSLEQAAREVNCSPAVAGYIVRSAQRYVRDNLK